MKKRTILLAFFAVCLSIYAGATGEYGESPAASSVEIEEADRTITDGNGSGTSDEYWLPDETKEVYADADEFRDEYDSWTEYDDSGVPKYDDSQEDAGESIAASESGAEAAANYYESADEPLPPETNDEAKSGKPEEAGVEDSEFRNSDVVSERSEVIPEPDEPPTDIVTKRSGTLLKVLCAVSVFGVIALSAIAAVLFRFVRTYTGQTRKMMEQWNNDLKAVVRQMNDTVRQNSDVLKSLKPCAHESSCFEMSSDENFAPTSSSDIKRQVFSPKAEETIQQITKYYIDSLKSEDWSWTDNRISYCGIANLEELNYRTDYSRDVWKKIQLSFRSADSGYDFIVIDNKYLFPGKCIARAMYAASIEKHLKQTGGDFCFPVDDEICTAIEPAIINNGKIVSLGCINYQYIKSDLGIR